MNGKNNFKNTNSINNTKEEVDINTPKESNNGFFKKFFKKGFNVVQNVKECVQTIKKDFVDDMKEHYTYVTKTYNQVNQARNNHYQNDRGQVNNNQISNNRSYYHRDDVNSGISEPRYITTREAQDIMQNNIYVRPIQIVSRNQPNEFNNFFENIIETMINEHVRHQVEQLNEVVQIKLTQEQYNSLIKTHIMTKTILDLHNITDTKCSICQELVKIGDSCAITSCNHLYHTKCSIEWFINKCIKPTCPICRKDVRDVEI